MNVSIAIATYNRAGELEKTLSTLARLQTAECPEHEILVIDNNSTDGTQGVVTRMSALFGGRLRYIQEKRQGLSHARNRAIDEARHEIVAYLDDDVDVDPMWLKGLSNAYESGDIAGVGGRASLVYPCPKPKWISESLAGWLTRVELGPNRRRAGVHEIYGVNLSFRNDWLRRAGNFRTDIGRVGNNLLGDEDNNMIERVSALGGVILYEPMAAVGHRVPESRMRRSWFWKRCFWGGVTSVRVGPDGSISAYELLRSTWHIGLACLKTIGAGFRHGPLSSACFERFLKIGSGLGKWFALVRELRSRARRSVTVPESTFGQPALEVRG